MKGIRYHIEELRTGRPNRLDKKLKSFSQGNKDLYQVLSAHLRTAREHVQDLLDSGHVDIYIRREEVCILSRTPGSRGHEFTYEVLYS